ncbi:hypothetical protein GGR56DRAFT_533913 [Xylariaceae sp. FL0804]|nr:hypothetical protein GGR56DRAFT_533913 [Xylariaceae sp. FL0804]
MAMARYSTKARAMWTEGTLFTHHNMSGALAQRPHRCLLGHPPTLARARKLPLEALEILLAPARGDVDEYRLWDFPKDVDGAIVDHLLTKTVSMEDMEGYWRAAAPPGLRAPPPPWPLRLSRERPPRPRLPYSPLEGAQVRRAATVAPRLTMNTTSRALRCPLRHPCASQLSAACQFSFFANFLFCLFIDITFFLSFYRHFFFLFPSNWGVSRRPRAHLRLDFR